MSGRDILRVLWSEGLRVTERPDGSLALIPPERVTADLLQLACDAKPEIAVVVAGLPAAGLCPVCGDPSGEPDLEQAHCGDCAVIAAERLGLARDISGLEAHRAA